MSRIVEFRERIITTIRDNIDRLLTVDWFEGVFDEQDVEEWAIQTPAVFVSVSTAPTTHLSTGELHLDLKVVCAVVVQDEHNPRDADAMAWDILEKIAVLANLGTFGEVHAGPATGVRMERIKDPELRREGVILGIVEWMSGLTIGNNLSIKHEFIFDPHTGQMVTVVPQTSVVANADVHNANGDQSDDQLQIIPE